MPRKEIPKSTGVFEKVSGSGVWWIRYRDQGQLHREKVGRRQDAIDLYKLRKAELLRGRKLPPNLRQAEVRFKELAEAALKYSENHHGDKRNVKSRIGQILPEFAERIASEIKPADIDGWIAEHTATAGTANRYRAVFSLIYREAVRNGRTSTNPARLVRQRKESSGRIRYLLDEEEDRLCKWILKLFPEHMPELTIAVGTGMRKSEQYGLIWERVDFKRKEVHLQKTKNGEARDVPMSAAVIAAFLRLKQPNARPADRVFTILDSRKWFEAARERAGLGDFHWHDCRHTFCSRLAMAGVPLKTIQALAGHKTIAITARYAHLAPNTLHAAVELIRVPGYKPEQSIPKSIPSRSHKNSTPKKAIARSATSN
jgi:integrase